MVADTVSAAVTRQLGVDLLCHGTTVADLLSSLAKLPPDATFDGIHLCEDLYWPDHIALVFAVREGEGEASCERSP